MAMKAMYNAGAQLSLAQMNKNITKAGNALAKLSSGQRIIGLQDDDSASFGISEKMREQIRSLLQDNQNVQNGSSMIKIAERGIDQIIQEIDRLKQLAINAANDSNTGDDRRTIQKEFNSGLDTINDIAIGTEYNGKKLLDGTWAHQIASGGGVIAADAGDYPIKYDGVYTIEKGYTGTITVNAQNVKLVYKDSPTPLENVTIIGREDGKANLWIDGLNIINTATASDSDNKKNIIKFQGNDNVLTLRGENDLIFESSYTEDEGYPASWSATINVGDGLRIEGDEDSSLNVENRHATGAFYGGGAAIGTDRNEISDASIVIGKGVKITAYSELGAAIGSGFTEVKNKYSLQGSIGDITIENEAEITVVTNGVADGIVAGAGIGGGHDSNAGNIQIGNDAVIDIEPRHGAGIGCGFHGNQKGTSVGTITISKQADKIDRGGWATGSKGELVGEGDDEYWQNASYSVGAKLEPDDLNLDNPSGVAEPEDVDLSKFNPLWIQHGTQSGQRIHVYINSMQTKDLELDGVEVITRDKALSAIAKVESALEYALNEATNMGAYLQRLDYTDSNVTTMGENVQNAESVIRDVDMAKEMTEYTKYNILTQSSQAMLAQANQNGSAILSLL